MGIVVWSKTRANPIYNEFKKWNQVLPWTLISLLICVHLSEAKQTYFPESVKLILLIWWLKLDPMRFTLVIQYLFGRSVRVRWYESGESEILISRMFPMNESNSSFFKTSWFEWIAFKDFHLNKNYRIIPNFINYESQFVFYLKILQKQKMKTHQSN